MYILNAQFVLYCFGLIDSSPLPSHTLKNMISHLRQTDRVYYIYQVDSVCVQGCQVWPFRGQKMTNLAFFISVGLDIYRIY